jgi:hypothetical protein
MLLPRHMLFQLVLLTWLLGATPVQAQIPLVASEFTDHPLLTRFPDSSIVDAKFLEGVNHLLVLGSLQRTREQVTPEASERIRGNVTQLLYEISQDYTGADVIQFFREQAEEKGYVTLFGCEGRACGSSNYWANDIFKNRILYGPERNQYYVALRTAFGIPEEPSLAIYVITRANRRIYAYVEVIETGGELPPINIIEPDAVLTLLREDGSVVLPSITFEDDDTLTAESELSYLVQVFESDPALRVYLVAHLGGSADLSVLQQRSLNRANQVKQALVAAGIEPSRVSAQGVGPLAPSCSGGDCRDRVELVLQPSLVVDQ